jgi:hypothetical protein
MPRRLISIKWIRTIQGQDQKNRANLIQTVIHLRIWLILNRFLLQKRNSFTLFLKELNRITASLIRKKNRASKPAFIPRSYLRTENGDRDSPNTYKKHQAVQIINKIDLSKRFSTSYFIYRKSSNNKINERSYLFHHYSCLLAYNTMSKFVYFGIATY